MNMKRLVLLDSLRGIAALVVFFHHIFLKFNSIFVNINNNFVYRILNLISNLNVEAVLFFFILSGFSINISIRNSNLEKNEDINKYLYKRFKRILPTYILALVLTYIIGIISNDTHLHDYSMKTLLGNLFFLQTSKNVGEYWIEPFGLNGPLWSLSYEMFYYLAYPIFYILIKKLNTKINKINFYDLSLIIIAFASFSSIFLRVLFFTPWFSFLSYFYVWFLGVYAASIYLCNNKYSFNKIALIVLVSIGYKIINYYLLHSTTVDNIFSSTLIFIFGIFLYKNIRILRKFGFKKIESFFNLIFKHVGLASYSLYIYHFPLLAFISKYYNPNGFSLLLISLTIIVLSIYLEKIITKPAYKIFKRNYLPQSKDK